MADYGEPGAKPAKFIPPITQETLAEMVGTTRSRVSFFMNRFRRLGFIVVTTRQNPGAQIAPQCSAPRPPSGARFSNPTACARFGRPS